MRVAAWNKRTNRSQRDVYSFGNGLKCFPEFLRSGLYDVLINRNRLRETGNCVDYIPNVVFLTHRFLPKKLT